MRAGLNHYLLIKHQEANYWGNPIKKIATLVFVSFLGGDLKAYYECQKNDVSMTDFLDCELLGGDKGETEPVGHYKGRQGYTSYHFYCSDGGCYLVWGEGDFKFSCKQQITPSNDLFDHLLAGLEFSEDKKEMFDDAKEHIDELDKKYDDQTEKEESKKYTPPDSIFDQHPPSLNPPPAPFFSIGIGKLHNLFELYGIFSGWEAKGSEPASESRTIRASSIPVRGGNTLTVSIAQPVEQSLSIIQLALMMGGFSISEDLRSQVLSISQMNSEELEFIASIFENLATSHVEISEHLLPMSLSDEEVSEILIRLEGQIEAISQVRLRERKGDAGALVQARMNLRGVLGANLADSVIYSHNMMVLEGETEGQRLARAIIEQGMVNAVNVLPDNIDEVLDVDELVIDEALDDFASSESIIINLVEKIEALERLIKKKEKQKKDANGDWLKTINDRLTTLRLSLEDRQNVLDGNIQNHFRQAAGGHDQQNTGKQAQGGQAGSTARVSRGAGRGQGKPLNGRRGSRSRSRDGKREGEKAGVLISLNAEEEAILSFIKRFSDKYDAKFDSALIDLEQCVEFFKYINGGNYLTMKYKEDLLSVLKKILIALHDGVRMIKKISARSFNEILSCFFFDGRGGVYVNGKGFDVEVKETTLNNRLSFLFGKTTKVTKVERARAALKKANDLGVFENFENFTSPDKTKTDNKERGGMTTKNKLEAHQKPAAHSRVFSTLSKTRSQSAGSVLVVNDIKPGPFSSVRNVSQKQKTEAFGSGLVNTGFSMGGGRSAHSERNLNSVRAFDGGQSTVQPNNHNRGVFFYSNQDIRSASNTNLVLGIARPRTPNTSSSGSALSLDQAKIYMVNDVPANSKQVAVYQQLMSAPVRHAVSKEKVAKALDMIDKQRESTSLNSHGSVDVVSNVSRTNLAPKKPSRQKRQQVVNSSFSTEIGEAFSRDGEPLGLQQGQCSIDVSKYIIKNHQGSLPSDLNEIEQWDKSHNNFSNRTVSRRERGRTNAFGNKLDTIVSVDSSILDQSFSDDHDLFYRLEQAVNEFIELRNRLGTMDLKSITGIFLAKFNDGHQQFFFDVFGSDGNKITKGKVKKIVEDMFNTASEASEVSDKVKKYMRDKTSIEGLINSIKLVIALNKRL